MHPGSFTTARLARCQGHSTTEHLHQGVAQWQVPVVAVHTAEYVHDANFAIRGPEHGKHHP